MFQESNYGKAWGEHKREPEGKGITWKKQQVEKRQGPSLATHLHRDHLDDCKGGHVYGMGKCEYNYI